MTTVPIPATTTSRRGTRRVATLVTAGVACVIGVSLALSGVALVVYDRTQRDSAGYLTSDGEQYATSTYAFTSQSLDVPTIGSGGLARGVLGKVRITSDSARPAFLGIARAADVERYLGSVNRAVLSGNYEPADATEKGAGAPSTAPANQDFWAASASGAGQRSLDWKLRDGDWVAVLMNKDGSRGIASHLRIGAEFPGLGWTGAGLFVAGLALLAGGGFLLMRARANRKEGEGNV